MTIEQTIFFLNEIRSNNNCDETIEQGSPTTQLDAQHAKNLMSGALDGTDAADRLRWLLSQAERVVTVDAKDRRAVDRACKLIKEIDNGFDRAREESKWQTTTQIPILAVKDTDTEIQNCAGHSKKQIVYAITRTEAISSMYWLFSQAERAGGRIGDKDREAVRMAIDFLQKG